MMKKLAITTMMVVALGGSVLGLDNNEQNKSVSENEKVETIVQVEEKQQDIAEEVTLTEEDIFAKNDIYDSVVYLPVKAFRMQYNGIEYTLLADGIGEFIITKELLEDGKNYQILYGVDSGEIYDIEEGEFIFTNEQDLQDDKNEIKNHGVDKFLNERVMIL